MTFFDWLQMHDAGILCAVVIGVAGAWVYADKG